MWILVTLFIFLLLAAIVFQVFKIENLTDTLREKEQVIDGLRRRNYMLNDRCDTQRTDLRTLGALYEELKKGLMLSKKIEHGCKEN